MSRINLNIVATGDFSSVNRQLDQLRATVAQINAKGVGAGISAKDLESVNRAVSSYDSLLHSTGAFGRQMVNVQDQTAKFGRELESGKLKLSQYFGIMTKSSGQARSSMKELARQQLALESSVIRTDTTKLGKAYVDTPRLMMEAGRGTALARKEQQLYNLALSRGGDAMINWGKNTQWAGRQLMVGLTVPMVMFGQKAATAFKEFDQQMVRMIKVYGDGINTATNAQLEAIRGQVTNLAQDLAGRWGVAMKDTAAMASDLAATGLTGVKLLKATEEATRLATLGELDRQSSMKATIALQSTFGLSSQELAKSVDFLNATENATSTSLQDLVEGIPRAGTVVKQLGGDYRELTVMMVAMREAGVSSGESANAIKSALGGLINPTEKIREEFQKFGLDLTNIRDKAGGDPVKMFASLGNELNKLDKITRAKLIETLFGKYQFARVSALIENLGKKGSQTQKVFELMGQSAGQLAQNAQQELDRMAQSPSGKFQRALEKMQAQILPVGEKVLTVATKIMDAFASVFDFLDKHPALKNLLTNIAGLVALVGPVIMLAGVFGNFVGYLIKGFATIKNFSNGFKGFGEIVTAESVAAAQAGDLFQASLVNQSEAANVLTEAITRLNAELSTYRGQAGGAAGGPGPIPPSGPRGGGGGGGKPPRSSGPVILGPNGRPVSATPAPELLLPPAITSSGELVFPNGLPMGQNPVPPKLIRTTRSVAAQMPSSGPVETTMSSAQLANWAPRAEAKGKRTGTEILHSTSRAELTSDIHAAILSDSSLGRSIKSAGEGEGPLAAAFEKKQEAARAERVRKFGGSTAVTPEDYANARRNMIDEMVTRGAWSAKALPVGSAGGVIQRAIQTVPQNFSLPSAATAAAVGVNMTPEMQQRIMMSQLHDWSSQGGNPKVVEEILAGKGKAKLSQPEMKAWMGSEARLAPAARAFSDSTMAEAERVMTTHKGQIDKNLAMLYNDAVVAAGSGDWESTKRAVTAVHQHLEQNFQYVGQNFEQRAAEIERQYDTAFKQAFNHPSNAGLDMEERIRRSAVSAQTKVDKMLDEEGLRVAEKFAVNERALDKVKAELGISSKYSRQGMGEVVTAAASKSVAVAEQVVAAERNVGVAVAESINESNVAMERAASAENAAARTVQSASIPLPPELVLPGMVRPGAAPSKIIVPGRGVRRAMGGPIYYGPGGGVSGPGGPKDDLIPAYLSNGEFVVRADSVDKIGVDNLRHMNETGTLPSGGGGGSWATGGYIKRFQNGGVVGELLSKAKHPTRVKDEMIKGADLDTLIQHTKDVAEQNGVPKRVIAKLEKDMRETPIKWKNISNLIGEQRGHAQGTTAGIQNVSIDKALAFSGTSGENQFMARLSGSKLGKAVPDERETLYNQLSSRLSKEEMSVLDGIINRNGQAVTQAEHKVTLKAMQSLLRAGVDSVTIRTQLIHAIDDLNHTVSLSHEEFVKKKMDQLARSNPTVARNLELQSKIHQDLLNINDSKIAQRRIEGFMSYGVDHYQSAYDVDLKTRNAMEKEELARRQQAWMDETQKNKNEESKREKAQRIAKARQIASTQRSWTSMIRGSRFRFNPIAFRASGGPIYGPGGSTSDQIPAMLSNGEYVVSAKGHQAAGTQFLDAINNGQFNMGGYAYANGGRVYTKNGVRAYARGGLGDKILGKLDRWLPDDEDKVYRVKKGGGKSAQAAEAADEEYARETGMATEERVQQVKATKSEIKAALAAAKQKIQNLEIEKKSNVSEISRLESEYMKANSARKRQIDHEISLLEQRNEAIAQDIVAEKENAAALQAQGKGKGKGKGMRMGGMGTMMAGMGLGMVGGMLSSNENANVQAIGTMATFAGMGSMLGPYGMAAGAAIGAGKALYDLGENARNASNKIVNEYTKAFQNLNVNEQSYIGVELKTLSQLQIDKINEKTGIANTALEQFTEAIRNASEGTLEYARRQIFAQSATPEDLFKDPRFQSFFSDIQQAAYVKGGSAEDQKKTMISMLQPYLASVNKGGDFLQSVMDYVDQETANSKSLAETLLSNDADQRQAFMDWNAANLGKKYSVQDAQFSGISKDFVLGTSREVINKLGEANIVLQNRLGNDSISIGDQGQNINSIISLARDLGANSGGGLTRGTGGGFRSLIELAKGEGTGGQELKIGTTTLSEKNTKDVEFAKEFVQKVLNALSINQDLATANAKELDKTISDALSQNFGDIQATGPEGQDRAKQVEAFINNTNKAKESIQTLYASMADNPARFYEFMNELSIAANKSSVNMDVAKDSLTAFRRKLDDGTTAAKSFDAVLSAAGAGRRAGFNLYSADLETLTVAAKAAAVDLEALGYQLNSLGGVHQIDILINRVIVTRELGAAQKQIEGDMQAQLDEAMRQYRDAQKASTSQPDTSGGGSSGGGGGGSTGGQFDSKPYDDAIKGQQAIIDGINKEREARQKLAETQKQNDDFLKNEWALRKKIAEAQGTGDFLAADLAQRELNQLQDQKAKDDAEKAKRDAEDKRIAAAEAEIKRLQEALDAAQKANSGGGGGGGSSGGGGGGGSAAPAAPAGVIPEGMDATTIFSITKAQVARAVTKGAIKFKDVMASSPQLKTMFKYLSTLFGEKTATAFVEQFISDSSSTLIDHMPELKGQITDFQNTLMQDDALASVPEEQRGKLINTVLDALTDPKYAKTEDKLKLLETELKKFGITPGSPAYTQIIESYGKLVNDANIQLAGLGKNGKDFGQVYWSEIRKGMPSLPEWGKLGEEQKKLLSGVLGQIAMGSAPTPAQLSALANSLFPMNSGGGTPGAVSGKLATWEDANQTARENFSNSLKNMIAPAVKAAEEEANKAENAIDVKSKITSLYAPRGTVSFDSSGTATFNYASDQSNTDLLQKAYGGYISGPGGPRDDLIPARLSDGEYVVQANAVDYYGKDFLDKVNQRQYGGEQPFADGGRVGWKSGMVSPSISRYAPIAAPTLTPKPADGPGGTGGGGSGGRLDMSTLTGAGLMQWAAAVYTGKGIPYSKTANNTKDGFGCSGFVEEVLRHVGLSAGGAYSPTQMNTTRRLGGNEKPWPGDLLFWNFPTTQAWLKRAKGEPNHVGFYYGGGQMLHSSGGHGPNITSLSGDYDMNGGKFLGANRVLPDAMMKVILNKINRMTGSYPFSFDPNVRMDINKYHNGGPVGYARGKEVSAMLQGGEVVVPVKTVDKVNPLLDALTSGKMGLGDITNHITINGSNHSPKVIAEMVVGEIEKSMKRTVSVSRIR